VISISVFCIVCVMIAGLSARYNDGGGDDDCDSSDSSLWSVCSSPQLDYSPTGSTSPGRSPIHSARLSTAESSRSAEEQDNCSLLGDVTAMSESPSPSGEVFRSLTGDYGSPPSSVRRSKPLRIRHTALTRAVTKRSRDLSRFMEERSVKSAEIQVRSLANSLHGCLTLAPEHWDLLTVGLHGHNSSVDDVCLFILWTALNVNKMNIVRYVNIYIYVNIVRYYNILFVIAVAVFSVRYYISSC